MSKTVRNTRRLSRGMALGTGAACFFWGAFVPAVALAHTQGAVGEGVFTGFLHPMKGPDHMLAMLAVGMWGAQLGSPCIWALPIAFPMVMALGGALGILGLQIPAVETAIVVSVVVLGSLIALAARLPVYAATVVVGTFAIFHGFAHGAELPEGVGSLAYSLGFVVSTGLLHLTGILFGLVTELPGGGRLLRVAGGLIAAAGLYLFTTTGII
jgi:urease accessory protein